MKRIVIIIFLIALGSGSFAQKQGNLSVELAKSIMQRYPDPNTYPYRSWCYPQGYMLMGMAKLYSSTNDSVYYRYIMKYADEHVDSLGNVARFKGNSMDDMMAGTVIVWAYRQTGQEKYRKAAEQIRRSFDDYPRTSGITMFLYAIKKAGELGIIPEKSYRKVVEKAYVGLQSKAQDNPVDGLVDIVDACDGLCVQPSYDVYINYKKKVNAKEAVAGVLWGSWIVEKPDKKTDLKNWPKGCSPKEVGTKVANRFVASPHQNYGRPTPPKTITYPEVLLQHGFNLANAVVD